MDQFAVLGLGQFGFTVAEELAANGKEVLAIDANPERVDAIKDIVTSAVVADASDRTALAKFINEAIDCAVISLGQRIEASILATLHVKELGVKKILAKADSKDHGTVLSSVGATKVVYPSEERARNLARHLVHPNILDYIPLASGYSVSDVAAPESFWGKTLAELNLRRRLRVEVIAIKYTQPGEDQPSRLVVVPSTSDQIEEGCSLIVVGRDSEIEKLRHE